MSEKISGILDKCFEDICYAYQSDDYEKAKVKALSEIEAVMLTEVEIVKIIENHGVYLSPELDAFSMHKSGVKRLAEAILKAQDEKRKG